MKERSERYPGCLVDVVSGMFYSVVANRRQPNLYKTGGERGGGGGGDNNLSTDIYMKNRTINSAIIAQYSEEWITEKESTQRRKVRCYGSRFLDIRQVRDVP